jgi:hypothetical protein
LQEFDDIRGRKLVAIDVVVKHCLRFGDALADFE